MDDHIYQELMESGWDEARTKRRLEVFTLRSRGLSMPQVRTQLARQKIVDEETGEPVSERTLWKDWSKIRELMAKATAPYVTEVRDRAAARLEVLFGLTMGQLGRDAQDTLDPDSGEIMARGRVNHHLVETARRIVALQAELFGAIDRRGAQVNINAGLTPLELYEQRNGNGSGHAHGPFTPTVGRGVSEQVDPDD